MKLKTLFSLLHMDMESPLVKLPDPPVEQMTIGTARFDGQLDPIATLNLNGRVLTPERHSTVLRLFQLLGEAVASDTRTTLRIEPSRPA